MFLLHYEEYDSDNGVWIPCAISFESYLDACEAAHEAPSWVTRNFRIEAVE